MAIADVLKFDSNADIFAWRHPNTELNSFTQLIVNEAQEAVFVKNGQICDVFGPGRYRLTSDNLPILQKLINIPFGGRSPFSAEVWFINKAFSLDIKWGTSSPIQIQDPKYNVFLPVRAFGQFGIQVEDSIKFLVKLVGTMQFFNKNTLTNYFRGLYTTRVKDHISTCLIKSKISILEINAHLNEISEDLCNELNLVLNDYGINVVSFYVNDINVPEDDPAVKKLKGALAKRAEMDIIGYNYQQERTFDTLETAAGNQGAAGTVMGGGIGMGMGFGIGGAMAGAAAGMGGAMSTTEPTKTCPSCNANIPQRVRFCPDCGADTTAAKPKGATVKCTCGADLPAGTKFCSSCGAKVTACPVCGANMGNNTTCTCGAKKCSKCGEVVPAGTKFCSNCGSAMTKKCSKCGADIADNSKFCTNCGNKV